MDYVDDNGDDDTQENFTTYSLVLDERTLPYTSSGQLYVSLFSWAHTQAVTVIHANSQTPLYLRYADT